MDKLDAIIRRAAEYLHEGRRQQGIAKRQQRDREARIRRGLDQLHDRILLHFPPTKREARHDLSDKQFKRLQQSEAGHRLQLFMMLVRELAIDEDEWESPLNF